MTDLTAIRVATGEAGGQGGGGDGVSTHLHAPPSAFASTAAAGGSIHTRRPPDRSGSRGSLVGSYCSGDLLDTAHGGGGAVRKDKADKRSMSFDEQRLTAGLATNSIFFCFLFVKNH